MCDTIMQLLYYVMLVTVQASDFWIKVKYFGQDTVSWFVRNLDKVKDEEGVVGNTKDF